MHLTLSSTSDAARSSPRGNVGRLILAAVAIEPSAPTLHPESGSPATQSHRLAIWPSGRYATVEWLKGHGCWVPGFASCPKGRISR